MPERLNPETLISIFFRRILGRGRYPRGFPEPVGSILCKYRAKRSHGDLIPSIFHVFHPDYGSMPCERCIYLQCKQLVCLQYSLAVAVAGWVGGHDEE